MKHGVEIPAKALSLEPGEWPEWALAANGSLRRLLAEEWQQRRGRREPAASCHVPSSSPRVVFAPFCPLDEPNDWLITEGVTREWIQEFVKSQVPVVARAYETRATLPSLMVVDGMSFYKLVLAADYGMRRARSMFYPGTEDDIILNEAAKELEDAFVQSDKQGAEVTMGVSTYDMLLRLAWLGC